VGSQNLGRNENARTGIDRDTCQHRCRMIL
jgi:hypothetical protein